MITGILYAALALFAILLFVVLVSYLSRYYGWKEVTFKSPIVEAKLQRREAASPLQFVTVESLRETLTPGRKGRVSWIDRNAVHVRNLKDHGSLVIMGETNIGKTREAIELIQRAISRGIVDAGSVIKLNAAVPFLTTEGLLEKAGIDPDRRVLLLVDDLPYHFSGERLERLADLLRAFRPCKDFFVLATARSDQLTPEHQQWLAANKFHPLPLGDLDREGIGRLVDLAAGAYGFQIDDSARTILIDGWEGIPGLILLGMELLHREGVTQVAEAMARKIVKDSLSENWAESRRRIIAQIPAARYVLDALGVFYAARVTAYTYLVLRYAHSLWNSQHPADGALHRARQLRRALKYLNNFEIVDDGQIITFRDYIGEGMVSEEAARDNLEHFLTRLNYLFQQRFARRFYRYVRPHAWAYFDLGQMAEEKKAYPLAERMYRGALKLFPHSVIYNNLGSLLDDLKRPEEAEAAYQQAIEKDPNHAAAYNNLGSLLDDLDRPEEAEVAFRQAIAKEPNLAQAYYNLGISLVALKRPEEAEAAYRQALEKNPNYAHAYHKLGNLFIDLNRPEEAEAVYLQAIEKDPNYAPAYNNLGSLLSGLNRPEEAEAAYRQAIEKDPNLAKAYYNLGILLADLKRPEEAEAAYRQAIEKDSNNAAAYNNLGNLLMDLKRPEEAEAAYRQAIEKDPNDAAAYYNLGHLFDDLKRPEEAEAAYRQAIEKNPNYAAAYSNLGSLLDYLNRPEEAEAAFRQAIEKNPNLSQAYYNLGISLAGLKRPAEAEAAFRQAIEKNPNFAAAYNNLGILLADLKRPEEAEAAYRQAIEKDTNNATAYNNLGGLLSGLNRPEEAEAAFRQAIEKNPNYAAAYNNLGILLANLKHPEEAEAAYRQAIEKDLNDADAYYGLACLKSLTGDTPTAFEYLRFAMERGQDRKWAWEDPDLVPLRSDPRFEQIVGPKPE